MENKLPLWEIQDIAPVHAAELVIQIPVLQQYCLSKASQSQESVTMLTYIIRDQEKW